MPQTMAVDQRAMRYRRFAAGKLSGRMSHIPNSREAVTAHSCRREPADRFKTHTSGKSHLFSEMQ
jgi:hypothetical protein